MQTTARSAAGKLALRGRPPGVWRVLLLGLAVMLIAFAVRVMLTPGFDLGMDGGVSVTLAVSPLREVIEFSGKDVHPPAYYLLLKAWLRTAGESPFAAKYLTVLAGVATVAAVWSIARRCAGEIAALTAAGLIALGATPVGASLTVRDLAFGLAIGLVGFAWFLRTIAAEVDESAAKADRCRDWLTWCGIGGLNALAVLTSYAVLPIVLATAIVFVAARPRRPSAALTGAALSLALVAPWLIYASVSLVAKATGQESQRPLGAPVMTLGEFLVRELALVVTGEFGEFRAITAAVVALLIAVGLAPGSRARPRNRLALLAVSLAGLLTSLLVFATVNLWLAEGFAARYGYVALPFLTTLVGCGVAGIWSGRRQGSSADAAGGGESSTRAAESASGRAMPAPSRLATRAVLTCGVGLVLAGGVVYGLQAWIGRPSLPSSFWEPRALVDYLDRVSRPHDAIVFTTPEQSGYYELLSRRRLPWRHFTIGAGYLTDDVPVRSQEVLPALGAGRERVWVVLYQSGLPGTEPMREWLARNWWLAGAEWIPDSQVLEYRTSGPAVKPIAPVVFTGDGGAVGLEGLGVPTMAYTSDYLAVSLQWRVIRPTAHAQTVFVHLIGPDGRRYAQRDTQPGGGLWPFDVMEPASVVPDRHALAIPADAPAGDYVLQIGLYAGDQRLASSTGGTAYQVSGITIAGR